MKLIGDDIKRPITGIFFYTDIYIKNSGYSYDHISNDVDKRLVNKVYYNVKMKILGKSPIFFKTDFIDIYYET